jgi:hypothetical protein
MKAAVVVEFETPLVLKACDVHVGGPGHNMSRQHTGFGKPTVIQTSNVKAETTMAMKPL